jgi:dienelactone hydrolase
MRQLLASLLLALSLAAAAPAASAGQFVDIEGGSQDVPVRLTGYLARPPGEGPFPAVVLLHGCGGFHSSMLFWADTLARWGYAALAVDSFGPRNIETLCTGVVSPYQLFDGYAALRHLAARPFVRPGQIAVMGFSQGGWAVLEALEKGGVEKLQPAKFRAGIAFYPVCKYASGIMTTPLLVLIGDADDWTPAADCRAMAEGRTELGAPRAAGDRSMVDLVIYPGAHHAFDAVTLSLAPGRGVLFEGHRVEYNEPAMRDALTRVRDFLKRTLD